ncbi:helix-turn-helix domain-containing protein [Agromyces sp. NPDC058136]|uniref:helix-turn-helix domain-containing protein n=1 Tax=Agromyces sp. NPDC058136 TaxID=3346354 RepID=UPI0036DE8A93
MTTQLRTAPRPLRLFLGWLIATAGALAIYMSWGALHDLALHVGGMPADRAAVFPIVVDLPALAAMLIALLVPAPSRGLRALPWFTFVLFSALTVLGNAASVAIEDPAYLVLGQWPAIVVNAVPAIALLLTTHLAAVTVYRRDDARPMRATTRTRAERATAVPTPAATRTAPVRTDAPRRTEPGELAERAAQRAEVLQLVADGTPARTAARLVGTAPTNAQRWVDQARRDGTIPPASTTESEERPA